MCTLSLQHFAHNLACASAASSRSIERMAHSTLKPRMSARFTQEYHRNSSHKHGHRRLWVILYETDLYLHGLCDGCYAQDLQLLLWSMETMR